MRKSYLFLLLFPLLLWGHDPAALWLSWKDDPTSTMVIQWLEEPNKKVEYRAKGKEVWQQAEGKQLALPRSYTQPLTRVELNMLTPNTTYEFRLQSESTIYKFKTLSRDPQRDLRFIVGGDMFQSKEKKLNEMNALAASKNPEFVLIGGDIAYSASRFWFRPEDGRRWFTWLKSWRDNMVTKDGVLIPIVAAIGNHETNGSYGQTPNQAQFFYTLFPLPEGRSYRFFNIANQVGIWILDSDHTNPVSGVQTDWLARSLESSQGIPYKFAIYHVPAYPSVRKINSEPSKKIREHWVPLFEKYNLDVAFENHDHTYKRTVPLLNNKENERGVTYIGDGGWAVSKSRKRNKKAWYLKEFAAKNNFCVIQFENGQVFFKAYDDSNEVIDSYHF